MLAMAAVALLLAACAGGSSDSTKDDRFDTCPDLPREECLLPGDVVNVYEALSLEQAQALHVFHDGNENWVLGDSVQTILRRLDLEVVLEPWALRQNPFFLIQPRRLVDPRYGPDMPSLLIDLNAQAMGYREVEGHEVQWPVPTGFVEEIMASYSDSTPTPPPADTPDPFATPIIPTARPTETPIPPAAFYFDHPEGELIWDGLDDRASSIPRAHCEPPAEIRERYGIPARIEIDGERGFWYATRTAPQTTWNVTGYHHEGWQIWRGPSQESIYLINPDEPGLAFEYRDYGCI